MKNNKPIIVFFFMVLCISIRAQNLVPNYSFENIIQCTTEFEDFNGYVSDWTGQGQGQGLGYFTHQCPGDSTEGGSVPYNYYYGFQYAHMGDSYASIGTFAIGNPNDTIYPYGKTNLANARNYIETELTSSLQVGVKYYVTFFVNLQNASDFACNDIGAYFSDSAIVLFNDTSIGKVKSYLTPQVANDPKKQELTDTLNWMKISGGFVAKGGEKYIVIGNFKNDSTSSIKYLGQVTPDGGEAWYYIDDVIVSPDSNYADSLESVNELKVESKKMKVYPNPSKGVFNFQLQNVNEPSQLEVYNMMGQKVYQAPLNPPNRGTSETTISLPIGEGRGGAGIYLYRITSKKGEPIASGKLVIE